jgi:hypothetical protein
VQLRRRLIYVSDLDALKWSAGYDAAQSEEAEKEGS